MRQWFEWRFLRSLKADSVYDAAPDMALFSRLPTFPVNEPIVDMVDRMNHPRPFLKLDDMATFQTGKYHRARFVGIKTSKPLPLNTAGYVLVRQDGDACYYRGNMLHRDA